MSRVMHDFKTVLTSEPDDLFVLEFYDEQGDAVLTIGLATGSMRFKIWLHPAVAIDIDDTLIKRMIEYGKLTLRAKVSATNAADLEAPPFTDVGPELIVTESTSQRSVRKVDGQELFRISVENGHYRWSLLPGESTLVDLDELEHLISRIKRQM